MSALMRLLLDKNVVRYLSQWRCSICFRCTGVRSRRVREAGFTREDAKVLALGTFGTDIEGAVLGVQVIATYDRPLARKWALETSKLRERLSAMTGTLEIPFRQVRLPNVLHPEEIA